MSDIKGLVERLRSRTAHWEALSDDRGAAVKDINRVLDALELMQEALQTLASLPAIEVNGGGVAAIARAALSQSYPPMPDTKEKKENEKEKSI